MTTPDLLVNLIVAPIAFLLLVVVRERVRRAFLPRLVPPRGKRANTGQAFPLPTRENVKTRQRVKQKVERSSP